MSEACVGVKIFPMLSSARYDLRASGDPKRNAGANAATWYLHATYVV